MKISITGSSATGKTTLSKELVDQGVAEYYITVDARSIIDKYNIKNIDEFSDYEYLSFQAEWFERKYKIESEYKNFVTDRSYIDAIAYMETKNLVDKTLIEQCFQEMKKYDIVLYLPYGSIIFESDGYRSENMDFHKMVDENIVTLLENYNIPYYKVDVTSLSDRVQFVKDLIKRDFL